LEHKILQGIDHIEAPNDFREIMTNRQEGILKWKIALRTIHYYDCLDREGAWANLSGLARSSVTETSEAVKRIVDYSRRNMSYKGRKGGISYPVASTVAYFFSKGQCPIIDWRAVSTLKNHGYKGKLDGVYLYSDKKKGTHQLCLEDDGWDDYYKLCHDIIFDLKIQRIQEDTPIRVLDKALWWVAKGS
jgi:hypothetical protein